MNTNNQPVYVKQISQAARYDQVAADEQIQIDNSIDVESMSPDTKQTRTKLNM